MTVCIAVANVQDCWVCFYCCTEMHYGIRDDFSSGALQVRRMWCSIWRWSLLWAGWKSILQVIGAAVYCMQLYAYTAGAHEKLFQIWCLYIRLLQIMLTTLGSCLNSSVEEVRGFFHVFVY